MMWSLQALGTGLLWLGPQATSGQTKPRCTGRTGLDHPLPHWFAQLCRCRALGTRVGVVAVLAKTHPFLTQICGGKKQEVIGPACSSQGCAGTVTSSQGGKKGSLPRHVPAPAFPLMTHVSLGTDSDTPLPMLTLLTSHACWAVQVRSCPDVPGEALQSRGPIKFTCYR